MKNWENAEVVIKNCNDFTELKSYKNIIEAKMALLLNYRDFAELAVFEKIKYSNLKRLLLKIRRQTRLLIENALLNN